MINKCPKCGGNKLEEFDLCSKCRKHFWDNRKVKCPLCGGLKSWKARRCRECMMAKPNSKLSKVRSFRK